MKVPVLICCFNRPETTERVLEAVRSYAPAKLYVACDGPREREGEADQVARVRALFENPGWPCDIRRRFLATNVGCTEAVHQALQWFFSGEDAGIVLEDDTVATPAFFQYCQEGLARFAEDKSIQGLTGNHWLPASFARLHAADVSLTRYFFCWGWASWADRIRSFSLENREWNEEEFRRHPQTLLAGDFEKDFWASRFRMAYRGDYPGWATRLLHQSWMSGRLWITPSRELVSNIGFGENATHTRGGRSHLANDPPPVSWPGEFEQDELLETLRFSAVFNRDWVGVGNLLAERDVYHRMIAYKKRVFELENILSSPFAASRAAIQALAASIKRRWIRS